MPKCMVAALPPPTVSFRGQFFDSSSSTTNTYTGVDLGLAQITRQVAVGVLYDASITSLTVNGVVYPGTPDVLGTYQRIYKASVPTGGSVTITVVKATATPLFICVWSIYYLTNTTPFATNASDGAGGSSYLRNANLNTAANGVVLGYAFVLGSSTTPTLTWTGITENTRNTLPDTIVAPASNITTTASTPLTARISGNSSVGSLTSIVTASYR